MTSVPSPTPSTPPSYYVTLEELVRDTEQWIDSSTKFLFTGHGFKLIPNARRYRAVANFHDELLFLSAMWERIGDGPVDPEWVYKKYHQLYP